MTQADLTTVTLPPGYRLSAHGSIASTNAEAMRLALAGDPGRLWVTADAQIRGRGRSGRVWTSVPGNLYASLLLRLAMSPVVAQQLALVAGVAVIDAVRAVARTPSPLRGGGGGGAPQPSASRFGVHPLPTPPRKGEGSARAESGAARLKWPNDILVGDAKLGGILLDCSAVGAEPNLAVVIGIGLNVAGVPDGLGRAATSLAAQGRSVDRSAMLTALVSAMDSALTMWEEGAGFPFVRAAWLARAGAIGERISVNAGGGPVAGSFFGLDNDGALLLRDELGVARRFTYGDVTLADVGGKL